MVQEGSGWGDTRRVERLIRIAASPLHSSLCSLDSDAGTHMVEGPGFLPSPSSDNCLFRSVVTSVLLVVPFESGWGGTRRVERLMSVAASITSRLFQSFFKSQFPHKLVISFLILIIIKDTLTNLCGN